MQNKHLLKIQCLLMIKKTPLIKPVVEANFFNQTKGICENPRASIILHGEILNIFLLRSGTRQGCPLSPLLLKTALEVLATAIREAKEKI